MRAEKYNKNEQCNQKYSLEDYIAYRDLLDNSSRKESNEVIFNDSFIHAEMVLTYILEYALNKNIKEVDMYCGKFSLFRDSAKCKVEVLRENLKPQEDDKEMMQKWQNFDPYNCLLQKFEEYMAADGCMNVIVESDISAIISETVWKSIGRYTTLGKLRFKKLSMPLRLSHFIVAGKSYRQENDDCEKTAICCFKDEIMSKTLTKRFQILELMSESYKF